MVEWPLVCSLDNAECFGRGYFGTTVKLLVSGGFQRLSGLESGAKPGVIDGAW